MFDVGYKQQQQHAFFHTWARAAKNCRMQLILVYENQFDAPWHPATAVLISLYQILMEIKVS